MTTMAGFTREELEYRSLAAAWLMRVCGGSTVYMNRAGDFVATPEQAAVVFLVTSFKDDKMYVVNMEKLREPILFYGDSPLKPEFLG